MRNIIDMLEPYKLVPVIEIDSVDRAKKLADVLVSHNLPVAEVTFRTANADKALAAMKKAQPDMLVGAGTVLSTNQVDLAIESGADFLVSPGLNQKVVAYALAKGIPMLPGINNPSLIEQAMELDLQAVKFFPAEASGGVPFLKAILAPYRSIRIMPTGGISLVNLCEYLAIPAVFACGGSWIVKSQDLESGNFEQIGTLVDAAVMAISHK
jgi:2-dehydro-3-deoxyphosphogluconate aldolase/(4S)-4-hydroxy-2-oxoglutarate aldolase